MTTPRDDDALSWAGDDDPTLTSTTASEPATLRGARSPRPEAKIGDADTNADLGTSSEPQSTGDDAAPAASSFALVSLGILAGIYLLYTVGWVIGGLQLQTVVGLVVVPTVSLPALALAIAAPALWFLASYVLTRHSRAWVRLAWLVAGALLLVPWPLLRIGGGL